MNELLNSTDHIIKSSKYDLIKRLDKYKEKYKGLEAKKHELFPNPLTDEDKIKWKMITSYDEYELDDADIYCI